MHITPYKSLQVVVRRAVGLGAVGLVFLRQFSNELSLQVSFYLIIEAEAWTVERKVGCVLKVLESGLDSVGELFVKKKTKKTIKHKPKQYKKKNALVRMVECIPLYLWLPGQ